MKKYLLILLILLDDNNKMNDNYYGLLPSLIAGIFGGAGTYYLINRINSKNIIHRNNYQLNKVNNNIILFNKKNNKLKDLNSIDYNENIKDNSIIEEILENPKDMLFLEYIPGLLKDLKIEINKIIENFNFKQNLNDDKINLKLLDKNKGLIISGSSGIGKTFLAKGIASKILGEKNNLLKNIFYLSAIDLINLNNKDSNIINDLFNYLREKPFSVCIINNIDLIFNNSNHPPDLIFKNLFLKELNKIENLFLIGLTNNINNITNDLFKNNLFYNIKIKIPNANQRLEIINYYLNRYNINFKDKNEINKIVNKTNGFLPRNLELLINKMVLDSIKNKDPYLDSVFYKEIILNIKKNNSINGKNIPLFINDELSVNDISGLDNIKEVIENAIDYIKNYEKYRNINASKGILLYGPPGTGKTYIAKIIASNAGIPIFITTASGLLGKYVGETESNIQDLFKAAREYSPAIIFIDELDSIAPNRLNAKAEWTVSGVNQLLQEIDGVEKDPNAPPIFIIATTNLKEYLDPAILRSGRIDVHLKIGVPTKEDRRKIISYYLNKYNIVLNNTMSINDIVDLLNSFTPADISEYMSSIVLYMKRNNIQELTFEIADTIYKNKIYGLKHNFEQTELDLKLTAYHEAGHAIMMILLREEGLYPYELQTLTIESRSNFLGAAIPKKLQEIQNHNHKEIIALIDVALGGRAAEEVIFEEKRIGSNSDLSKIYDLAKMMLEKEGMGSKFFYPDKKEINEEIEKIVQERYLIVKNTINKNKNVLHEIYRLLMIKKTLYPDEIKNILLRVRVLS